MSTLANGVSDYADKSEHRKAALVAALDAALDVVCEAREELRDPKIQWTTGEKQNLAVTLEGLGRICFAVARECERKPAVEWKGAVL